MVCLLLLAAFGCALIPTAANAWCPPPLGQISVREYTDTDDSSWGDPASATPNKLSGSVVTQHPWLRIVLYILQTRTDAPKTVNVTKAQTDENLTPASGSSSGATASR